jgi:hypothetical protein
MSTCLFCSAKGPFSTIEHIIPESLGNSEITLRDIICDSCQNYFGKEIEQYVLEKSPLAFWRTYLDITTKKGKFPTINLSQPQKEKGKYPSLHSAHDNIGFSAHDDGSLSVDIDNQEIVKKILAGEKQKFLLVLTPKLLYMFGRFLCKVGIELLYSHNPDLALSSEFNIARKYARFGEFKGLWPIFQFTTGNLYELKQYRMDKYVVWEDSQLYSYSLFLCAEEYYLFQFSMGTDNWVISLNNPFPKPTIQKAFPNTELNLIWYDNY